VKQALKLISRSNFSSIFFSFSRWSAWLKISHVGRDVKTYQQFQHASNPNSGDVPFHKRGEHHHHEPNHRQECEQEHLVPWQDQAQKYCGRYQQLGG
jgi:hypothetical protein